MPRKIAPRIVGQLEAVYGRYNRPEFIRPDPMQFLLDYADPNDREIVGLISSSLAFGTVKHILASVQTVLARVPEPRAYLESATRDAIVRDFRDFQHRYVLGEHLSAMLWGAACAIREHGSLDRCFAACATESDQTIVPALETFARTLLKYSSMEKNYLIPIPSRGSACKRWLMYLRWMIRCDAVDLGGWNGTPPSKLIVPLDTHMFRIARALRLTKRNQANLVTALEVTAAFKTCVPDDPVRYDFALTRLGIRRDTDIAEFFAACGVRSRG
jgi:uncharacterized protein (TIGR02757 family)